MLVANPTSFARKMAPVGRGVPLHKEAGLLSVDQLYLRSPAGALVPAGFTVLARWGGPPDDGTLPIKWVLVEFVTDIGPQGELSFELMQGSAPRPAPTIAVEESSGFQVSTGPCDFTVGAFDPGAGEKKGLLTRASCGGEVFFEPPSAPDVFVTRQDLSKVALSDFPLEEASLYRKTDVSVTIKAAGAFGPQGGGKLPLTWTAYLTFYGGTGLVDCLFRLQNRNAAVHPGNVWLLGSSGSIFIEELSYRIPFGADDGNAVPFHLLGEGESWSSGNAASVSLYQDSSGGENWNSFNHVNHAGQVKVSFKGYKTYADGGQTGAGLRADGALAIESGKRVLGASVRHFWQNFPKALRYQWGGLDIALFPGEFNDAFELQGGEYKTHETVLAFAVGAGAGADVKTALRGVHQPLVVRTPAKYTCSTGALLYDLAPRKTFAKDTWEDTLDKVVVANGPSKRSMITQRETIDEYGWRNFGDAMADHETDCGEGGYEGPISHDNNQYDGTSVGFIHHARIDDMPQWFPFGEEYARHSLDVDVYHTQGDTPAYNGGVFAHTTHDVNAGRSTHRTYPELEITQGCTQYTSGGPGLDYIHMDGMVLYHYFTGYPFVQDVLGEVADWTITRMGGKFAELANREYANCLGMMILAYRLFGDDKYLETAKSMVAVAGSLAAKFDGQAWAGAMAGKSLGRYLDLQKEFDISDESSSQALDALVSMANLAYQNFGSTDVQAYRFSEMWLYAYKHTGESEPNHAAWMERAFQTHEATAEANWAKGDYSSQKEMTILATNGNLYYYFKGQP
jgi:hypothetical protein